jgi:hypothetical protein
MKKSLLLMVFFSLALTAYSQVKVTFTVDMSVWQKNGYFNRSTDTVRVAGDFNGWSTTANDFAKGAGADSLKYSAQVSGVSGGINYKFIFIHGGAVNWEDDPNRTATIGASDVTLPTVYFKNVTGKKNRVWFKVDMSLPVKTGQVTPGVTNVYLAGDMTTGGTSVWATDAKPMSKGASDSIYSVLVDSLFSGQTRQFKYIYGSGAASAGTWEDGDNRTYFVPEKDSSIFSDYWNRQNPNIQTGNGKINFTIDMSVMTKIGIYNPVKDSVLISGGFNGWTTSDPNAFMSQNPINDSSYFITHTFASEPYGDKPYKYVVKKGTPTGIDTIWKDGYERPLHWGGGNRVTSFKGEANKDTSDYYDNVHPDWFIPAGTNLNVKFTVDMIPAMDPVKQAVPFDPAHDTLYWLSEEPAFARAEGWYRPSDGHMRILKLTADGAGIYSGTLNVKDPSFNAFEYRYEWQKGSDGSWVTEPAGFDNFAYRVRYAGQDNPSHFPKNPWNMPRDTWTNNNIKTDQEIDPYTSLTIVNAVSLSPTTYSLSQNYPNPFNPSTTINFSIQKSGMVALKIYNILGQEVTSIVNLDLKAGSYSYTFDASKLSSGVYFYSLSAGNFSQVKKMMLLK